MKYLLILSLLLSAIGHAAPPDALDDSTPSTVTRTSVSHAPSKTVSGVCGKANGSLLISPPTSNLCSAGNPSGFNGTGPWNWSCNGTNGGRNASCSAKKKAPPPINASCGGANGSSLSTAPRTDLCSIGSASSVKGSGPWNWSCGGTNGGTNAACSAKKKAAPINASCGSANGSNLSTAPKADLCSVGSASSVKGSGPWNWSCGGANGGTDAACSAKKKAAPINASCGSANGSNLSTAPKADLCSVGSASSVKGSGPWNWSCGGANGGTNAACSAKKKAAPINASCGSANGSNLSTAPKADLCSVGSASSVKGSGPWNWSCGGANGGTNAACSAKKKAAPINASCGSANGSNLSTAPKADLCSVGSASSVKGSGPWNWSCGGANGGTKAACSAKKKAAPINASCGSAHGNNLSTAPKTDLCSLGNATAVTGNGPWNWVCNGSNGGSNVTCLAKKVVKELTDDELLSKFAPVMYFEKGDYLPSKITDFLSISALNKICGRSSAVNVGAGQKVLSDGKYPSDQGIVNISDSNNFKSFDSNCDYFLDVLNHDHGGTDQFCVTPYSDKSRCISFAPYDEMKKGTPTIYGKVIRKSGKIYLSYNFFYFINQWVGGKIIGYHEGDWEGMVLELNDKAEARRLGLSQHVPFGRLFAGGETRPWCKVEKIGNSPVVYVGQGGHPTYFEAGDTKVAGGLTGVDHHSFTDIALIAHDTFSSPTSKKVRYTIINIDTDTQTSFWFNSKVYWGQDFRDKTEKAVQSPVHLDNRISDPQSWLDYRATSFSCP